MNAMKAALIEAGAAGMSFSAPAKPRVEKTEKRAKAKFREWTALNEHVVGLKALMKGQYGALEAAKEELRIADSVFSACIVEIVDSAESTFARAQKYITAKEVEHFDNDEKDRFSWLQDVLEAEMTDKEADNLRACTETIGGLTHERNVLNKVIQRVESEISVLGADIYDANAKANVINFNFGFARMNEWQIEQVESTTISKVVTALLG